MIGKTRNSEVLKEFIAYCEANPELRFWQALRNWSGHNYVIVSRVLPIDAGFREAWKDTFYWEGKNGGARPEGEAE